MNEKLNNGENNNIYNIYNNQTNSTDNNEFENSYEIISVEVLETKQKIFYNNLDNYFKYEYYEYDQKMEFG